ncbi:hypothetical protein [Pantoea sp. App145]|uniref:hypothetical protein n=1 Tax=Pantoea sp. App145 TaxID=3071567 RepID=UPI003A813526
MQHLKRHNFVIFPYRPCEHGDGEFNNGGIDLIREPHRITELHELHGYPWFKEFFTKVNASEGLFMTFGCAIGILDEFLCGYIDFSLRPNSDIRLRRQLASMDDMFIAYLNHSIPDGEMRRKSIPYAQQISEWKISPLEIHGHTYAKLNLTFHARQEEGVKWLIEHLQFFLTKYFLRNHSLSQSGKCT